jgi:hypothetical protein
MRSRNKNLRPGLGKLRQGFLSDARLEERCKAKMTVKYIQDKKLAGDVPQ